MKKLIGISIPCYNEVDNVIPMVKEIDKIFKTQLSKYDYFVQFIDNDSNDGTQKNIMKLCEEYPDNVRAIFNAKNFPMTSGYHGLLTAKGDCTISIPCDFQVPLETIPQMIKAWEDGGKIICLIKSESEEKRIMWYIRQLYYKVANKLSDSEIIRNFTGSGLYDKIIMDTCRELDDSSVSFIQFISEYGYDLRYIYYKHEKRRSGKTKHSFWNLLNMAIVRFVNSSTIGLRFATVIGAICMMVSFIIGCVYLVLKLLYWNEFAMGIAPLVTGFFFFSSIQLFFIGLIGEYLIRTNKLLAKRPLVMERCRINFDKE